MFCPWRRPWKSNIASKMDSLQGSLLILGLLLVIGAQTGNSLQCHICNSGESYEKEKCADDFVSTEYLTNCTEVTRQIEGKEYIVCRKIKQFVDSETRIIRQCGTAWREDRPCVERTSSDDLKITYCECNTDGCNAAPALFSVRVALLTALSALLALIMHS